MKRSKCLNILSIFANAFLKCASPPAFLFQLGSVSKVGFDHRKRSLSEYTTVKKESDGNLDIEKSSSFAAFWKWDSETCRAYYGGKKVEIEVGDLRIRMVFTGKKVKHLILKPAQSCTASLMPPVFGSDCKNLGLPEKAFVKYFCRGLEVKCWMRRLSKFEFILMIRMDELN